MKEKCSICHKETVPIEVHGHTQCCHCGGNYSSCCQGEQAMPTKESEVKMPTDTTEALRNYRKKEKPKQEQHDAHVKTWEAHRRKFEQGK